ncbi:Lrp/AsnC family transcriptional regulator [Sulfitobacter sp. F26204]|uniref:Lrp/AsnC family transcriptional regulator n=1 Tax=Sulfitobacter sp. F26204 TaxID=2996014 RepID=UPI00225E5CE5|nr:Lrp/AsnC family transcriptional regulator [Sulfitobacter sp. F26204]MCX7559952.1 Lrp/AsnC family transcriptional regulator [Sulfitobacter sp. F26204]
MDDLDNQIIAALRADSRAPLSALADALGTTRTTLRARIARLQERGEIVGFTVLTRADVMHDAVRGLMMIGIEGRGTERVIRQLNGFAEVRAVHSTNGRWDVIIEIGTATLEDFDAVLTRIRRLEGIVASETNLLLKTRKAG